MARLGAGGGEDCAKKLISANPKNVRHQTNLVRHDFAAIQAWTLRCYKRTFGLHKRTTCGAWPGLLCSKLVASDGSTVGCLGCDNLGVWGGFRVGLGWVQDGF